MLFMSASVDTREDLINVIKNYRRTGITVLPEFWTSPNWVEVLVTSMLQFLDW